MFSQAKLRKNKGTNLLLIFFVLNVQMSININQP